MKNGKDAMRSTQGRRIYAIGDIHGCIDELRRVQSWIAADLRKRPHPDPLVVYLGDYCDRGPDSKGVIDTLIASARGDIETVFLFGNHDKLFVDFLQAPNEMATERYHWLSPSLGGGETLASYGVADALSRDTLDVHAEFQAAVPPEHIAFLAAARLTHVVGSYLFVHAGIRPGVALPDQDPDDLIWIRAPFLTFAGDLGHIVVHGHTVVDRIENRGNRIGIDTGAVFGGRLSCLVLEDDSQSVLHGGRPLPCPPF